MVMPPLPFAPAAHRKSVGDDFPERLRRFIPNCLNTLQHSSRFIGNEPVGVDKIKKIAARGKLLWARGELAATVLTASRQTLDEGVDL